MEIKSNKIDSANAEISATIMKETIDANLEKMAKQLAKTTTIQGFRKGKVPVSVVKQQFGDKLVQDAEGEALREVLNTGLDQMGLSNDALIGEPNITKFDKQDDKIEVEVKIAMRPEIELGEYSSFAKEFKKPKVKATDVTKRLKEIAEAQAPLRKIKRNRKMKEGDTAVIDYEGFLDGEPFSGGKGEGFELKLGSGQFIPGFEDQLIGVKRDEEVELNVTFPAEYQAADLAGKDVVFKVKVTEVKEKDDIELNDELAAKMLPGEEGATLETLKEEVEKQMVSEELAKLYNEDLKPKLLESLVSGIKLDLPEFVVDQEIDMALNKKAGTMSEDEIKELREDSKKLEALRETFRADAQESVKATFIIDALATAENVKVEENDVMQTIYYEAMRMGQDPQKAYDQYKDAGYLPAIQMSMVEDKVLSQILDSKMKEA